MNLFSISNACCVLGLAALLAGCDKQNTDQSAVSAVQTKNTELDAQYKEMELTIQKAQALHQTYAQVEAKKADAEKMLEDISKELLNAINETNNHIDKHTSLSEREIELEKRLQDLKSKFADLQTASGINPS